MMEDDLCLKTTYFLLGNFYFSTFMTLIFITLLEAVGHLSSVLLGEVLSGPSLRIVSVLFFWLHKILVKYVQVCA